MKTIMIECLGTEYGNWRFIPHDSLHGCTVVSAGVGEDMSFDVEFASKYNSTIHLYDPTPRAIAHFEKTRNRLGASSTTSYVSGGDQPVEAYDLSRLTDENFIYKPLATWNKEGTVRFFRPSNQNHVSHSILNWQRDYNTNDSNYIEVQAVKLSDEISKIDKFPSLLKLDIEAAVLEVMEDLFSNNIFIDQCCVEYDEVHNLNAISMQRINQMNKVFAENDYTCVHNTHQDYLFVRNSFLKSL